MLTFISAYNNNNVLSSNLLSSPCLKSGIYQQLLYAGKESAGLTYTDAFKEAIHQYLVFIHQDVYLPTGWDGYLIETINSLNSKGIKWGVLGCYGINTNNARCGYVYSNGMGLYLGEPGPIEEAKSVDELVIVINKNAGIIFDDQLPGYHFYGTDICLSATANGYKNYIIKNLCIHNSLPVRKFDTHFWRASHYIRKKWHSQLPIYATCTTIPKSVLDYYLNIFRINLYYLLKSKHKTKVNRLSNPILKVPA